MFLRENPFLRTLLRGPTVYSVVEDDGGGQGPDAGDDGDDGDDAGDDAGDDGDDAGDDGGDRRGSWRDSLPDEIRKHPVLDKYDSAGAAVKALVDVQKLIGRDKIPMPPEDATKEDWDEVYARIGRPDTPDGYDFSGLEIDDGLGITPEAMGEFKAAAHEAGLRPSQAEGLMRYYTGMLAKQKASYEKARADRREQAETELRENWGSKYDDNLKLARKAMDAVGDDELVKLMDTGLGDDVRIIRAFAKVGEMLSEDKLQGKPKSYFMTPDEAKAKIAEIRGQADHPYHNRDHPAHRAAVDTMEQLYAMAHPGKAG